MDGNWTTYVAGTYCTTTSDGVSPDTYEAYWDNAYAGGGAFRFAAKYVIAHVMDDKNHRYATCHSSEIARLDSANYDTGKRQALNLTTGKIAKTGDLVRVSYDDGSWEIWRVETAPTQASH